MSAPRRVIEAALVPVKLPIAGRMGDRLSRRGTDETATAAGRSGLVLAPHPDDETLGCGATIMRKVEAGTAVTVVVVSDGATWPPEHPPEQNIAVRHAELEASCRILGLPEQRLRHWSFPETHLDEAGDELVDAVADVVRAERPDDVFVTSAADPHADHAALGRATRRALAGTTARILAYPIWQWTRPRTWTRTVEAASAAVTVRTDGYLERKDRAMAVFHSQMSAAAGGDQIEGLTPQFLGHFLGPREMFFPLGR
ncbi:MAG: PIG-L deacetylase family protein [Acidimicrobiales bacterium]